MNATHEQTLPRNVLLKQRRESMDMSREVLADEVKLHPSYIHHIENGTRTPPMATLYRIADVLGISHADFDAAGPAEHRRQRNRDKTAALTAAGSVSQVSETGARPSRTTKASGSGAAGDGLGDSTEAGATETEELELYDQAFKALVAFSSLARKLGPEAHRQLLKMGETMVKTP